MRKMITILIHGSGHKSSSWNETVSYLDNKEDILCPELYMLLNGKEASYNNLFSSFAEYCNNIDGQINLCGISLGGILALDYALEYPSKVKSLILIGTPYKIPKFMFSIQNILFKVFPKSVFENMAFDKRNTFILGSSMKKLDFSEKVQNIKCPTLIICGRKDSANIKSAYCFSEKINNSRMKILENTGHIVNEENPQALAKLVNSFYNDAL